MRIVHIIPTLDRAGAEKQLTLLACGLPREDFDVHVLLLTRSGPLRETLEQANIPVTLIGKTWKIDPAAYWRLKREIKRLAPDLVHTWIFAANAYGRAAAHAAGVKHIVGGERCVDRWKVWHELAIDRYLARISQRIVTNSSGVREFYASRGIPAEKFVIIPNGAPKVDTSSAPSRAELLAELGLPEGARLVGAVGRLWPQKRVKDLIWATELLNTIRQDVHLLIVGDGPQRWRLERYRDQVQIDNFVHFLGNRPDVPRLLPHFDLFWLGSEYEGQSNALMEAMAAGVPVIATDIPGNRDLVTPDKTGYLVPLGGRADFARLTNDLLNDPARAQRLGQAAQQRIAEHFSVEKMVQRHAELYRELAGNS